MRETTLDSVFTRVKKKKPAFKIEQIVPYLKDNPGAGGASLFFNDTRTECFYTEDSKLYITPREKMLMEKGVKLDRGTRKWDGLSSRVAQEYLRRRYAGNRPLLESDFLWRKFCQYRKETARNISQKAKDFRNQWSPVEIWNFSLVGAIMVGMISMAMIYRIMGPGASAGSASQIRAEEMYQNPEAIANSGSHIMASSTVLGEMKDDRLEDADVGAAYIENIVVNMENQKKDEFVEEMRQLVKGYPIEKMLPYIAEKDRVVAAFMVSIAKKESNWGKRVPVLDGEDCFNYWGYRGIRKRMGTGGHTCFDSRKDAVDTVAKRLETLVKKQKLNTPDKLVIWKCGSACHRDNPEAVRKWISDVELYFGKIKK